MPSRVTAQVSGASRVQGAAVGKDKRCTLKRRDAGRDRSQNTPDAWNL